MNLLVNMYTCEARSNSIFIAKSFNEIFAFAPITCSFSLYPTLCLLVVDSVEFYLAGRDSIACRMVA